MVSDILSLFDAAVVAVGSWFTQILEATGMESVYLTYTFVFLCVSILLMPIIGGRINPRIFRSGGSDQARPRSGSTSNGGSDNG